MKPRRLIVTFEMVTDASVELVRVYLQLFFGLGVIKERPLVTEVRKLKCMDPAADGPASTKPARKSVAANRRRK